MKKPHLDYRGISLISLMVTVVLVVVLSTLVFLWIDPLAQTGSAKDKVRLQAVNILMVAIKDYSNDHNGSLPFTGIISTSSKIVLCTSPGVVMPSCDSDTSQCLRVDDDDFYKYLYELPVDPNKSSQQDTGYYAQKDETTGQLIVGACDTYGSAITKMSGLKVSCYAYAEGTCIYNRGGIVTTDGDNIIHTFTSSGTFEWLDSDEDIEVLVVAGGGGGGGRMGGGGGAGGYIYDSAFSVSEGAYTVTVGAGGAGGIADANGTNGNDSIFETLTTAVGGGGGGRYSVATGLDGGSGGGSGGNSGTPSGGAGTAGQGYAGGDHLSPNYIPGSGGGASEAGKDGVSGPDNTTGGDGIANSISGVSVTYAGGGGAGGYSGVGSYTNAGGAGGGGTGTSYRDTDGTNGTDGLGGGGGGGGWSSGDGGDGGDGIVIIRY